MLSDLRCVFENITSKQKKYPLTNDYGNFIINDYNKTVHHNDTVGDKWKWQQYDCFFLTQTNCWCKQITQMKWEPHSENGLYTHTQCLRYLMHTQRNKKKQTLVWTHKAVTFWDFTKKYYRINEIDWTWIHMEWYLEGLFEICVLIIKLTPVIISNLK